MDGTLLSVVGSFLQGLWFLSCLLQPGFAPKAMRMVSFLQSQSGLAAAVQSVDWCERYLILISLGVS